MPQAVVFPKAMVAAAHPLAARVGVDILRSGGNAIDAMVAVQMVLNVVEPQSSGIGGGCFILWHDQTTGQTHFVDGREECPQAAKREDFLTHEGKVLPSEEAMTGGHAVGVPGTVAAMHLAHQRWGKRPWRDLLAPAIDLAEHGIGVTPRLRWAIQANHSRLQRIPASRAVFLLPDSSVPEIGHVLRQPDLARTLSRLAEEGPQAFYTGEIARQIVAAVQQAPLRPGRLTLDDLANYRAVMRPPFKFHYRGYEIIGPSSPSAGTQTLAVLLGILEATPPAERPLGSAAFLDLWARAESVAFAFRDQLLGDADFLSPQAQDQIATLLHQRDRLREWTATVVPGQRWTLPLAKMPPAPPFPSEGDHTTHFSIIDAAGNVVSCTSTIEHGMGSALVVPGAGFLLNNELTDFDVSVTSGPNALETRRQPRRTALEQATTLGGKRPRSSMTPLIVCRDGQPVLTIGSPGGSQIIGVVGQVVTGIVDHELDMQSAINLARASCRNRGQIDLEAHFPTTPDLLAQLSRLGWPVRKLAGEYQAWGGAHGIRRRSDGQLEGGADPRREGAVRGY
jgi:gamma-glutamyltranspeptidase/glutathione hydrolase